MNAANGESPACPWPFDRDPAKPLEPPPELLALRSPGCPAKVQLWDSSPAWVATTYEDVQTALLDSNLSSDTSRHGFPHVSSTAASIRGNQRSFVRLDDPEHAHHRSMVAADFILPRVKEMHAAIGDIVRDSLDRLATLPQPVDLVTEFAARVPSRVMLDLLDLPVEDGDFFQERMDTWNSLSSTPEVSQQASKDVFDYLYGIVAARTGGDRDDIISRLIRDQVQSEQLTVDQLVGMLHILLVGGYDTTANMIALGTIVLTERRDQLDRLVANPGLWPAAVEELLRYLSVTHHAAYRIAKGETMIGRQSIDAGDAVIAPITLANWDPKMFADPEVVDFDRNARQHLAFGFGIHQCLGQALARAELRIVFHLLFERYPDLAVIGSVTDHQYKNAMIYGVERLPVVVNPTGGEV